MMAAPTAEPDERLNGLGNGEDEDAFRAHLSRVPFPLTLLDLDFRPLLFSRGWSNQAVTPEQPGVPITDHFAGSGLAEALTACIRGDTAVCQLEGTGERWWAATISRWPGHGPARRLVLNLREITDTIRATFAATQAQQRLSMALKLDRSLVHEINLRTGEVSLQSMCNDLERFFVARPAALTAQADDRPAVQAAFEACAQQGKPFHLTYRLDRDDGVETWIDAIGERFSDVSGAMDRVITVFKDVTERHRQQQRVEALAYRDVLTGLSNRAAFQAALAEAVAGAQERAEGLGVVMVDMDYFKQVNDTFGHDAGDALLKALAGQMRRAFRQSDTIARLGGDEFAVVLRDIRDPAVLMRPVAALEALLKNPVQYNGQEFFISTSIGVAFHAPGEPAPGQVLKNADLAMYEAKTAGRDRSVLFQNTMRTRVEERLQLLRDVRRGLAEGEFALVYQPIIDLVANRVEGLEALIRWRHPDQGMLAAATFSAAFDDSDSAPLLSDFAFEGVLEQMRAWMDAGLDPPPVAINVSAAQLRDGRLARELPGRLTRWGVAGDRLSIEINETMTSGRGDPGVSEAVRQLAACGLKITLDNFGVGQGSLGNPRDFPVDRLKISKSFVANFDPQVVGSILRVGQALDLQVVADGVEGDEALSAVREMGCSHAQGFHFARPMTAEDAGRYLRAATKLAAAG